MSEHEQSAIANWSADYDHMIQNPPKEGDILRSADGSPVILVIELKDKSPPFVYGRAYVPEIVGSEVGWFLQSADSEEFCGWMCILMPRARTRLIQKYGLGHEVVEVASLRVIRQSQSGKSLLCEVHRFLTDAQEEQTDEHPVEVEARAEEQTDESKPKDASNSETEE